MKINSRWKILFFWSSSVSGQKHHRTALNQRVLKAKMTFNQDHGEWQFHNTKSIFLQKQKKKTYFMTIFYFHFILSLTPNEYCIVERQLISNEFHYAILYLLFYFQPTYIPSVPLFTWKCFSCSHKDLFFFLASLWCAYMQSGTFSCCYLISSIYMHMIFSSSIEEVM